MPDSANGDARDGDDKTAGAPVTSSRRSAPSAAGSRATVISVAALVVAVAALGLAGWSALRGPGVAESATASGAVSADEQDAAKTELCAAFRTVREGVALNTNAAPPGGPDDQSGAVGVVANARLSLAAGGQYLLSRVDPAAPEELADDARELGNLLADIGATAIAGVPTTNPEVGQRMQEAERLSAALTTQCDDA